MDQDATTIMDLNDDCLMEIFQYLSIYDAFSIIGCFDERIDNVAYDRIAQLKQITMSLREPPEFTHWQLEVIGRNLKSLYISAGYSLASDSTLKYLKPICSQGCLQTLNLNYVQFDDDYRNCLLDVAPNLQYLNLNYCQLTDELLSPILENCTNLKTLSLLGNYSLKCESLFALESKCLNELIVEQNDYCKDAIQSFIVENQNVVITVYIQGRLSSSVYGSSKLRK